MHACPPPVDIVYLGSLKPASSHVQILSSQLLTDFTFFPPHITSHIFVGKGNIHRQTGHVHVSNAF